MKFTVVIPWPDPLLSPNSRSHWSTVARAKKKARWTANLMTINTIPPEIRSRWRGSTMVHLEFCPKIRRHRDIDNLVSSSKGMLDGLADALGTNDRYFKLSQEINETAKTGNVLVHITNLEALA